MEYKSMEYYDYLIWMNHRHQRRIKGLPVEPTPLQKQRAEERRNRWYALSSLMVDWQDKRYQTKTFAKALGYSSDCQLYMFLKRNGETLRKKYGGLPRVNTPSKVLKKYMEDEDGFKA